MDTEVDGTAPPRRKISKDCGKQRCHRQRVKITCTLDGLSEPSEAAAGACPCEVNHVDPIQAHPDGSRKRLVDTRESYLGSGLKNRDEILERLNFHEEHGPPGRGGGEI